MIKRKLKTHKGLVRKLRSMRDQINIDIQNMSSKEEQEYLDKLVAKWKDSPQQAI